MKNYEMSEMYLIYTDEINFIILGYLVNFFIGVLLAIITFAKFGTEANRLDELEVTKIHKFIGIFIPYIKLFRLPSILHDLYYSENIGEFLKRRSNEQR